MFAASIARSIPSESYVETTSLLLSNQKNGHIQESCYRTFKIVKAIWHIRKKFNEILNNKELMEKILKKMERKTLDLTYPQLQHL